MSDPARAPDSVATARAGGKVILLGEHAVVHGVPAIAAGIDLGATARARALASGEASVLQLGGRSWRAGGAEDTARAFTALLAAGAMAGERAAPDDEAAVEVVAHSDMPAGGGLGSSAALGVSIAKAVELLRTGVADPDRALRRARAWEEVFHGTPSGIDSAAALHGGCFRFSREHGVHPITPARTLWLCVGWTGAGASTKAMVDSVAHLAARKPELVSRAMDGIRALVQNAELCIESGDLSALGKLMDMNQMILAGLMVSTEGIETLCAAARGAGALGAKLTGAGGGGSVIALLSGDDAAPPVLDAWKAAGFAGFVPSIDRGPRPAGQERAR
ncbi:MAG: mevalonate kinase [Polyangiaceae bacterium]